MNKNNVKKLTLFYLYFKLFSLIIYHSFFFWKLEKVNMFPHNFKSLYSYIVFQFYILRITEKKSNWCKEWIGHFFFQFYFESILLFFLALIFLFYINKTVPENISVVYKSRYNKCHFKVWWNFQVLLTYFKFSKQE